MKKLFFLCWVLFFVSGTACAQSLSQWNMRYQHADQLFEEGKYKEALSEYQIIAENTGSPHAQFQVGWIYHQGLGVPPDCRQAVRWYTHAASRNFSVAQNNLYTIYADGCEGVPRNVALALSMLESSSAAGDSRAQANLSARYRSGDGVSKNEFKAYDLATRSAASSDIYGLLLLSEYEFEGFGVPANHVRGFQILKDAVKLSVLPHDQPLLQLAQHRLGLAYALGEGTPENLISAHQWLLRAASGLDPEVADESRAMLAEIESSLSPEQKREVEKLAKESALRAESLASEETLVEALAQSIDKEQEEQALYFARVLSDRQNVYGQYALGLMYYKGYGSLDKDVDEASVLFKRSCRAGNAEACINLAQTYIDMGRQKGALHEADAISQGAGLAAAQKLYLADIYMQLGEARTAEALTRQVLVADPNDIHALELLRIIQNYSTKD